MIFSKALVLKVLGGLAVCTGVTVGGVKLIGKSKTEGQGASNSKDQNNTQDNGQTESPSAGTQNPTNQDTQGDSQRTAGDGVNSNTGNPQAQTLQNPSGSDGNPQSLQTKPQSQVANTKTTITTSNAELLLRELGLECSEDSTNADNGECSEIISGKTINVEKGGTKREGITSLTIPSGAKIKYEKDKWDFNYNKKLKVTIEGGDIELIGGTEESQITKLEEFETYEVKEEGSGESKKYYLSRKTTIFDHKIKLLNIPKTCKLVTSETEASCSLTADELKKINFDGRSSDPSVVGGNTASLTILKTDDDEFADQKYKFILKTDHKIVISGGSGTSGYNIITNTNTEFKIKKSGTTLTLEKAWNLDTLAAKVGITDCTTADSANICTLPNTINVSNGEGDKIKDAKITGTSPKIKFLQDQPNHNQGFKFFPQADITLSGGNPDANNKKIESNNNSSYEIKKIENEWYLSKVTTK